MTVPSLMSQLNCGDITSTVGYVRNDPIVKKKKIEFLS